MTQFNTLGISEKKMVIYFCNNLIMCFTFSFRLKGVISDWLYSRPLHSLHRFDEVPEMFFTKYAFRRETKRNNRHLLTVKIRKSDNFKSYISYFQSQLAMVPNCDEDVSALAFISGLQVSQPLYNHPFEA